MPPVSKAKQSPIEQMTTEQLTEMKNKLIKESKEKSEATEE
jgi:hypothetical protein